MHKSTPDPEHLFRKDANSPSISKKKVEEYHASTVKVLYFSQIIRVDLQLSSVYHCTRAKKTIYQYCSKFRHLAGHTWATRFVPLIISMDGKGEVVTCIDGAHSSRADGKG